MVDRAETALEEIEHLGAELVNQERAARPDRRGGGIGDRVADALGQGRKRQARQRVIGMVMAQRGKDFLHIGRRSVDRDEAAVADFLGQVIDEVAVGVDRDQRRIGAHPFEDRAAEGADAGAVFHEHLAVRPVDRREHVVDQPGR